MKSSHRRLRLPALAVLLVLAGLGVLLGGLASAATDTKPFSASISVSPDATPANATADAWAGQTPTITLTITNDSAPQTLGSANITIPSGLTSASLVASDARVTLNGSVLQLRNLNLAPHASFSVSLTARVPCTPASGGYPWSFKVKQSNDFNGTGNDFVPTYSTPPTLYGAGLCSLRFATDGQPASAQRATNITADIFKPDLAPDNVAPGPVKVDVLDGSGAAVVPWWSTTVALSIATNPGGGSLSGTTSATPLNGTASFLPGGVGPKIDKSANGYKLSAASTGITATAPVSSAFDIVDSGQRCTQGQSCKAETSNSKFSVTVTAAAASQNDLLRVSLGAPDAPSFSCAGYTPPQNTDVLAFDLTTLTGGTTTSAKTVIYRVLNPTKPASKYELCFLSSAGSTPILLPPCQQVSDVPPCLSDRRTIDGAVVLTATAPAGDPWMR